MASPRKRAGVRVDATVHRKAQRTNIPTAELEAFAEEQEKEPKTLLYPRDPSLDPQLVWKGKDEQDRSDLAVPAVPIYIQEKISPLALIEELRTEKKQSAPEQQIDLFGAFNGLEFEQLVDFYQHSQQWTNRMILGDSLLVMASLAEKEGLKGKVQTVYIDPPYGIKFGSNWQVSTRDRDVIDGKAADATRQPEQIRAFRDTWEFGVHSYLTYLRDRLTVTRELLSETGSLFVQMGDENVHLVRSLLDEVFGSRNAVVTIVFRTTANLVGNYLGRNSDYLLWYAKDIDRIKVRKLFKRRTLADDIGERYTRLEMKDGTRRPMTDQERADASAIPVEARPYRHGDLTSQGATATGTVAFEYRGHMYHPGRARHWTTTAEGLGRLALANRLVPPSPNSLSYVRYLDDFPVAEISNVWTDTATGAFTEDKVYVVQTNTKVIERCILMTSDPGDLVVDPTCGSGTTAYVAEQWGRRWITIDTSRVALALARTRLMAARYPYYLLADSKAGAAKQAELEGRIPQHDETVSGDVSRGFVHERVPHLSLKSIANNADISEGMTRAEIDAAIASRSDSEILYDRPYADNRIVRVTGPFTVESLSPHRVLPADASSVGGAAEEEAGRFLERIIDYLRKAGVQNTVKHERLNFDRLDSWPGGVYIQAVGEYTEAEKRRTVAVSIGPEYGTVGPELVREAAKEAVKIADLLVVCGFAFESLVGDEVGHLGRLTILKARMNPDLSMGDELLKKTGAANLFMVFGLPDISIEPTGDGQFRAEIRGLDVYDPTTGVIRSHSTDDIACWFIDTDYDGESFFVRHAYFLGADDPYENLRRALRADIDEPTWSTLYSTTSRPFPTPESGKIAIKVINHYGDEVLKVFSV
ncbi:MAG TPA: site-specific DNA-methyltransferase [Candidatus Micrarchaeaceae archaeon]|nr:site-specific DNA-methyltransferase [Candidatus Micrarchaeaceae archaeon]